MKNIITISFSILAAVFIIGLVGFLFFNNRLARSKELKEAASVSSEKTSQQESKRDMGAVENGLKLQITSPSHHSSVTSSYITLRGKTVAGADVFVNDKETVADGNGDFSVALTLDEGDNPIIVVVNDAGGNTSEQEITILYEIPE